MVAACCWVITLLCRTRSKKAGSSTRLSSARPSLRLAPYNCPGGCGLVIDKHWIGNRLYLGNDLPEALAAFYEAERELIGATA